MNHQLATTEAYDGITVEVSAAQLRAITAHADLVTFEAERFIALVREIVGTEAQGVAAHLLTMAGMGAGYFRHNSTVIRRCFRERATLLRERKKKKTK